MALNWKPHTTKPAGVRATVLVAYPPVPEVDNGYVGRMYEVQFGRVQCEHSGHSPTEPYWWVYEEEVLEGLPGRNA